MCVPHFFFYFFLLFVRIQCFNVFVLVKSRSLHPICSYLISFDILLLRWKRRERKREIKNNKKCADYLHRQWILCQIRHEVIRANLDIVDWIIHTTVSLNSYKKKQQPRTKQNEKKFFFFISFQLTNIIDFV